MEGVVSAHGKKHNVSSRARKSSAGGKQKDIFLAVRQGSLVDVDLALVQMKESGSSIDSCNLFGLTPLHIATWRNHIPIVKRLLVAGADPNTRDGESGWSSLHRALHFGHLAVASILLQFGASITLEDSKSRTPIDLISGPVSQILGNEKRSVATEVYSWGSGVNYQLGTGNAHMQKLPVKVDCLHASFIKLVSAAKFHSVAVTARGELYTWGFGRGGRLGHPESEIHSGQAAVITPQRVVSGLGARQVRAIAAAKHHTVVATESGEVFTWGSNREGQLGYTGVDTQPTPRRVSILRSKIVAVAAANKHTAVVSDSGEIFTWGCNKEGQLGYGTSNSGSNYNPRAVEYLKGKVVSKVAAAKHHTVVLGADGEIYTWGHGLVNPRRVVIARNMSKHGGTLMNFHRVGRLHVVSVAAGMVHSLALTEDGALFYWVSSDPDLKCQQLYALRASNLVSVSAGKYWSTAVTSAGDVYMWDGKKAKDKPPIVTRLHGVKRSTLVSVGETHLLAVSSVYHPAYPLDAIMDPQRSILKVEDELDEGFMFGDMEADKLNHKDDLPGAVPTLKSLCEKAAVQFLLEPRNALQLLEIADSLQANDLKRQCEEIVIRNLDYIFMVSSHAISNAPVDVLAHIEELLATRSSEPWSCRRLPTPTAPFPAIIDSEVEVGSDLLGSQRIGVMSDVSYEGGSQGLSIEHGGKGEDLSRKQRRKKKTKPRPEELPDSHTSEFGSSPMKGSSDFELQIQDVVHVAEVSDPKASTVNHTTGESPLGSQDGTSLDFKKLSPCRGSKKKNRKGGLSMFLSGALDDPPKVAAPQPPPRKIEGPAWGGAKHAGISASLREIQDEQKKTVAHVTGGSNDKRERIVEDRSSGKVPLSSFLSSKPIPVAATHTAQSRDVDRNTPCWSASGTPPQLSQPSLRDIQMQEEKKHSLAHSPKTRTAGFAVSTSTASPSDSGSQNRWFRPEVDSPSSIRLIQIEEKAMKDLRRIYGSVRLVKNQS